MSHHADLVLLVRHEEGDNDALIYRLEVRDPRLGPIHEDELRQRLSRTGIEHIEALFGLIGSWPSRDEETARKHDRRLRGIGADLFLELVPEKLRLRLCDLSAEALVIHGSPAALQIVSNELFVPWELLKFPGDDSGGAHLAEAFALTRWLSGCLETLDLPLTSMALVVHGDENTPDADEEGAFVRSLAGDGRTVTDLQARSNAIVEHLAAGRVDGLHFTGHGFVRGDNPNLWSLQLETGDELYAYDVKDGARRFGGRRPLIFANACHSARGGRGLGRTGGLARAFLEAGAGAYVGAHWAVRDEKARLFAQAFYRGFLKKLPMGEAVRRARLQLRDAFPGDPTWLAYTAFAHPMASCRADGRAVQLSPSRKEPTAEVPVPTLRGSRPRVPRLRSWRPPWGIAVVAAGLLVLLMSVLRMRTPTHIRMDLVVSRVRLATDDHGQPPEITLRVTESSLPFRELTVGRFSELAFHEQDDESGGPTRLQAEGLAPPHAIFAATRPDEAALGVLSKLSIRAGEHFTLASSLESDGIEISVELVPSSPSLRVPLSLPFEVTAQSVNIEGQQTDHDTIVLRSRLPVLERFLEIFYTGTESLTLKVLLPPQPEPELTLLANALPVRGIELFEASSPGKYKTTLREGSRLRYPGQPWRPPVELEAVDFLGLAELEDFHVLRITLDLEKGNLLLVLDGTANRVEAGPEGRARDRRLSFYQKYVSPWFHPSKF